MMYSWFLSKAANPTHATLSTSLTCAVQTDSRLLWNIHVLSRVISRSQDAVLDYRAELLELISLCLETVKEKTVVQRVGDLAFCLMSGLTSYYTLDRTSVPVAQFEDPEWQATHWRSWGKNVDHDALQVEVGVGSACGRV